MNGGKICRTAHINKKKAKRGGRNELTHTFNEDFFTNIKEGNEKRARRGSCVCSKNQARKYDVIHKRASTIREKSPTQKKKRAMK